MTVQYIWTLTASRVVPRKDLILKCSFIHLKVLWKAFHNFLKASTEYPFDGNWEQWAHKNKIHSLDNLPWGERLKDPQAFTRKYIETVDSTKS